MSGQLNPGILLVFKHLNKGDQMDHGPHFLPGGRLKSKPRLELRTGLVITPMWSAEDGRSYLIALLYYGDVNTQVFSLIILIIINLFGLHISGFLLVLPTDVLSLRGKLRVAGLGGTEVCVGPTVVRVQSDGTTTLDQVKGTYLCSKEQREEQSNELGKDHS